MVSCPAIASCVGYRLFADPVQVRAVRLYWMTSHYPMVINSLILQVISGVAPRSQTQRDEAKVLDKSVLAQHDSIVLTGVITK